MDENTHIAVHVPATSANLGPGFDCVGIALDLWNVFELRRRPQAQNFTVETIGEGAGELPGDEKHLVAQTMLQELARLGHAERSGWHLRCHNQVPCGSGLGSSSTAILAGLIFAHALHTGSVRLKELLSLAATLEGHADNVAPAVLGGLVVAALKDGTVFVHPIPGMTSEVVVCVPQFAFLTSHARTLVPGHFSRTDAVFNTSRALLVVESIRTGNDALLTQVMEDRMHEPYRLPHIPGALAAKEAALSLGALAVCLSGAGPGLLAFARQNHPAIGRAMQSAFKSAGLSARYWMLKACTSGLRIEGVPVLAE